MMRKPLKNSHLRAVAPVGRRGRRGFTLLEALVGLAIATVIAAIVLSTETPETDNSRERYRTAASTLFDLVEAIAGNQQIRGRSSFKWTIGLHPKLLSQLTKKITTADQNMCAANYTAGQVALWTIPFWSKELLTTGTLIAPGYTVQDALVRISASLPTAGAQQQTLAIRMTNVALDDAKGLDLQVDGALGTAAGTVIYTNTEPTTVDYYFTTTGC